MRANSILKIHSFLSSTVTSTVWLQVDLFSQEAFFGTMVSISWPSLTFSRNLSLNSLKIGWTKLTHLDGSEGNKSGAFKWLFWCLIWLSYFKILSKWTLRPYSLWFNIWLKREYKNRIYWNFWSETSSNYKTGIDISEKLNHTLTLYTKRKLKNLRVIVGDAKISAKRVISWEADSTITQEPRHKALIKFLKNTLT